MVRCTFSASSPLVPILLSLSAAAQSAFIPEQGIRPRGNYQDADFDVVSVANENIDLYGSDDWITLTVVGSSTQTAEGQAKAQTAQNKNNPKEIELQDVIF